MSHKTKVLFVCSRNQWRSPTAEAIWRNHPALEVRSAGTSARRRVTERDIQWADVIIAMETEHKKRLKSTHTIALQGKALHVLDIPDDYHYMDEELVTILQHSVPALLGLPTGQQP